MEFLPEDKLYIYKDFLNGQFSGFKNLPTF